MVTPYYKPIGITTHQLAKNVASLRNEKTTHTGSLDPMAEGVVVILTEDDRFEKEKYTDYKKGYVFQILAGVETDSHDLLGIVQNFSTENLDRESLTQQLQKSLSAFLGAYQQTLPAFSAKRINGQSYFDLARNGTPFLKESQKVTIGELQIYETETIPLFYLDKTIKQKIQKVTGAFRQAEILVAWESTIEQLKKYAIQSLPILTLHARTSRRTYIRALVRDLSEKIGIPLTTYHILRYQNGPYLLADTKHLHT